MVTIDIGDLIIGVDDPALVCACGHDTCYVRQNDPQHHDECDCPKVTGKVALSISPRGDDSWESVYWSHLSQPELVQKIDELRARVAEL